MKIQNLFLLFGLMLMAQVAAAQCQSGDCRDGTGIYLFPSGAKYIGQFSDGQMNGIGSCYYSDGSKYQGQWVDGYPQGQGVKILADGTEIRGEWLKGKLQEPPAPEPEEKPEGIVAEQPDEKPAAQPEPPAKEMQTGCVSGDCRNGKGIYIYPSGAIYIGEFKDGEIHGIGACHYSDGSKYQGEWVSRYPEGRGTKIFPDGTKWTGNWRRGQPIDENGDIIENLFPDKELAAEEANIQSGCVEGDCESGQGTYAYPDGSKYEGRFRSGKPHGKGTFFYIDGDRYEGMFSNGLKSGEGVLYRADGDQLAGIWKGGEYVGKTELVEARQYGCLEGNCENGRGVFVFKEDGSKYTGSFQDNLPNGEGVMEFANGEKYTGQWVDGNFDGKGTLQLMDGTEVAGYWLNGVYKGEELNPDQPVRPEPTPNDLRKFANMKVWAVIVGVASYNHMPTLRYTDDDAYRMYAFLKSPEGGALPDQQIRILIDEDATREGIKSAMQDVFSKAGKNDLVMLYYSGHGLKGSFLPIDFDGFNNKLEHREVKEILEQSPAKYKLCIADACHSGSLLAMKSGEVRNVLENYYTTLAQAEAGTALIMSSKSEETSLESSGLRQGVFSHFLIRGLKGEADLDANKVVTIQELFDFINNNVRTYTGNRQSPVIKGDYDQKMTVSVIR
jgi:hypothetical protein